MVFDLDLVTADRDLGRQLVLRDGSVPLADDPDGSLGQAPAARGHDQPGRNEPTRANSDRRYAVYLVDSAAARIITQDSPHPGDRLSLTDLGSRREGRTYSDHQSKDH